MIHAFTSAAPNYTGKVLALCESLRQHCPEMRIHWLVADLHNEDLEQSVSSSLVDELIFLDDLAEFRGLGWLFQHDIVELSTAIKPITAINLLNRDDCELLIYFDPDQVIFSPLDDLVDTLRSGSGVLTPHLLQPCEDMKAVMDHELCSLRHGIFNLGFFGVRKCTEGEAFLEWWSQRCQDFCWGDWRSGVFTDQKWINFAPVFFPNMKILRSPRFNVAPWNIHQRTFEGTFEEGFRVEGEPLGFYHFTGLDSGAHDTVLEFYAAGNKAVRSLVQWYRLRTEALSPDIDLSWGLGKYQDGAPVLPEHRALYREREDVQAVFPDPFRTSPDGMCFQSWFHANTPVEALA